MALRLEPVTLSDRAVISDIITRANFDDPYGQTVWPGSTLESRTAGSYARLPRTMLAEGVWLMKAIDSDSEQTIAYAQWTLPHAVWKRLRAQHPLDVSADARQRFERERQGSLDPKTGEPKGMRVEVVDACTPAMEAAGARAFPADREYIMLDQVKTLPVHQRRGAGSMLVRWGAELADREGLTICLEATPFGLHLYEKFGFEKRAVVDHDVSRFGGPSSYIHTLMVRTPRQES